MLRKNIIRYCIVLFAISIGLPIATSAQQTTPTVLAELFSNINCPNCPGPDSTYEVYVAAHPGAVLINYHNSTTDPNDPFYVASLPGSQDRDVFYGGPQNDPSAWIDGFSSTLGNWETNTDQAAQHTFPGSIDASVSPGPSGIDTILFTVMGSSSVSGQVVYYVAIKESRIYFPNSEKYGNPPDSLWNDVFRVMLPSGNGSAPFSFSGTHHFTAIYKPNAGKFTGNEQNMTAVIFVQDASASSGSNHQVEAVGTVPLASPGAVTETTVAPANRLIIPENPLRTNGAFEFELASAGDVQVTIFDLLGRQVRTLVEGMMPAGETTVDLNGNILPAGCYIARLTVDGYPADQAKFIVAP
ncbi:MAG: T9SS type A sorting domain-containing protein [Candidatus Kapaibacterium sp.]